MGASRHPGLEGGMSCMFKPELRELQSLVEALLEQNELSGGATRPGPVKAEGSVFCGEGDSYACL